MTKNQPATKADLVADAAALGVAITDHLINDWVEVGLLDTPTRSGAGRGKGSKPALFPANQRRLFTELIKKRTQTKKISQLARIPMYLWACEGDDYVPTRQAQKAFRTWAQDTLRVSQKNALTAARAWVKQVAADHAPDKEVDELTTLMAQVAYDGRLDDPAKLEELLDIVIDPSGSGERLGSPGLYVEALQYVKGMVGSQIARDHVLDGTLPENMLLTARERQRQDLAQYRARQDLLFVLSSSYRPAKFKIPLDDQGIFEQVCPSLLLIIGALYYPDEGTDVRS
jgi:hypothetical protein